MKVAGWSTASVILRPSQIQIVPNPKQGTYSGCFGFFFSSYLKARLFPDYNRRSKHHWYFPFTPIPTSPKIPYFFNTFLFWVSRNMQHAMKEKEAVLLLNFQLINKKKQSDYTRVLVVINCELKMHGKFFNALEKFLHHALFFVLCFFQWHYNCWETSEYHTLWEIWLKLFSFSGSLPICKKYMWSSHFIRRYMWSKNPAIYNLTGWKPF